MKIDVTVPSLGESISEATIAKWYKNAGDKVQMNELLLELETEKVTLEVNASASGILNEKLANEGDNVAVGQIVASINPSQNTESAEPSAPLKEEVMPKASDESKSHDIILSPAAQKLVAEKNIDASNIQNPSGKDGRITKFDVISHQTVNNLPIAAISNTTLSRETRVKMSRLRKTIAQRLKDSQNTAAILTTFNEVDMHNVINLRSKYKDEFEKRHGTKLGFMSFFVQAVVSALKDIPSVNAAIEGDEIIYKNYYDIGVAVGTENGLVVPILRDADRLSFAQIEGNIANLGKKARDNKLTIADLTGGTFSISNGGVYGSLLSTPIINPPQSAILGMHKIQEKPVVVNGQIAIRPMMFLALSYDHRIIDGKEAVTFLVKVKNIIETPERLFLGL